MARRKDRLDALSAELQEKYGVKVETLVADLTRHEDLQKVGSTIASNERVAVLVNNAGTAVVGPSAELSIEQVEFQLDLNARSVTFLSQAILPGFLKRNSGTLINLGSVLSFFAYPFSTSYSASKAHVMLYTIGLHDELANTGIRVQAVLPSNTYSEIWEVSGMGVHNLDPETVMSTDDLVDAALAGLDQGKTVTLPSLEDYSLWEAFDAVRIKMFNAAQTKNVATRYGLGRK
ncbi:SDR family NAD(P)-dependent oxidoreductase [Silvibacterium acidisoli]|uniref:SDR family NAD(P)-dependent oxidoreductase n=1 Tax=Acidobacteriaceae bacterium ZG23-2 TaxID=2883246 RepID=UPI00406D2151